jgi:D-lactate dehydrogenase
LYAAKPQLKAFYQQLDPTNSFNPGIGKTTKAKYWGECGCGAPSAVHSGAPDEVTPQDP